MECCSFLFYLVSQALIFAHDVVLKNEQRCHWEMSLRWALVWYAFPYLWLYLYSSRYPAAQPKAYLTTCVYM